MVLEKTVLGNVSVLGVSTEESLGIVDCRKVRTVSLTARCTYNASAGSAVQVNCYFSANGKDFDTVAYAQFNITLTAGSTIQETKIYDFPEHGYMEVKVKNLDATYTATNVSVRDTVVKWGAEQKENG